MFISNDNINTHAHTAA